MKLLSPIAPTVLSIQALLVERELPPRREALGMEEKTVGILSSYADEVRALRDSAPADIKISLVRFMPEQIRLYGTESLLRALPNDAGLARHLATSSSSPTGAVAAQESAVTRHAIT